MLQYSMSIERTIHELHKLHEMKRKKKMVHELHELDELKRMKNYTGGVMLSRIGYLLKRRIGVIR